MSWNTCIVTSLLKPIFWNLNVFLIIAIFSRIYSKVQIVELVQFISKLILYCPFLFLCTLCKKISMKRSDIFLSKMRILLVQWVISFFFYTLSADLSELRTGSLNSWHEISLDHFGAALLRSSSRKKNVIGKWKSS